MMKRGLMWMAMTLMLAGSALAAGGVTGTVRDESAIRAIPAQIAAAWNKGHGGGIAGVYAANGTLVAGDGQLTLGRAEIARYHDRQFAAFLKGTRLTVQVMSVKFLTPDVAIMRTEGGILWPGESTPAPGNRGIQSFVVVKEHGAWRVALFQNTRIRV